MHFAEIGSCWLSFSTFKPSSSNVCEKIPNLHVILKLQHKHK
jgi:hypothetical protein